MNRAYGVITVMWVMQEIELMIQLKSTMTEHLFHFNSLHKAVHLSIPYMATFGIFSQTTHIVPLLQSHQLYWNIFLRDYSVIILHENTQLKLSML